MRKVEGFLRKSGWNVRDAELKGLPVLMGAKLSVGGEGSARALHTHNYGENEIFIVLSGTAKAIIGGEEIILGSGDGQADFLIASNEEHGIFDKSDDFKCVIVFLKQGALT